MRSEPVLRALLLSIPELLFLDEPTARLDPIAAEQFDELIVTFRRASPHGIYGDT